MYALRYRDNVPTAPATLVELTAAQVKALGNQDTFREGPWCYQYYDSQSAHRWVLEGGHHETYLWVDQGRVRRGRP